ncbi:hypothetical protein [Geodermatophilus amargosae]|uniref:hypothetical protein n=1 Tax=Geodermatophilus amargosae TaxID=1296565 RepID=UPI0034E01323
MTIPERISKSDPFRTTPELHALLYEWYFTYDTANSLARVVTAEARSVACIGTPTIASTIADRTERTLLVDADPGVFQRFPTLASIGNVSIAELAQSVPLAASSDAAVLDPPWYVNDILRWLSFATKYIRPGGSLYFVLFPELTRPSARSERQTILAHASRLGKVEHIESALTYSTPLFELEALAAVGCPDPGDWRAADLVIITDVAPHKAWQPPVTTHLGDKGWSTHVLGEQVVKLKTSPNGDPGDILSPVRGAVDNVLTSVSERDARRQEVDLWTSRNRVARVGQQKVVEGWLERLASSPYEAVAPVISREDRPAFDMLQRVLAGAK